jgi:hypothetical protein
LRPESSSEASRLGALLDEHHAPETNGRLATCRRCGERTDGPDGQHAPTQHQLTRAANWLDAQQLTARVATWKNERNT